MDKTLEKIMISLKEDASSLQKKFTTAQQSNEYRNAVDIMRLLKDTLYLISEYDRDYEKFECSTGNNKWYDMLKQFITNKQSMLYELSYDKDSQKIHRGTGKTTAIEKLAIEYDLPLFTSSFNKNEYNKRMNMKQYSEKKSRAFSSYDGFKYSGSELRKCDMGEKIIILVDEGFIDYELYSSLIGDNGYILIGFTIKK